MIKKICLRIIFWKFYHGYIHWEDSVNVNSLPESSSVAVNGTNLALLSVNIYNSPSWFSIELIINIFVEDLIFLININVPILPLAN